MKLLKRGKTLVINWNNMENIVLDDSFNGNIKIYIEKIDRNVEEDLRKIETLKRIPGLKIIIISTADSRIAFYLDELMKKGNLQVKKELELLNDYETRQRDELDFSKTDYSVTGIPYDYLMRAPKATEYTTGEAQEGDCIILDRQDSQGIDESLKEKINEIIHKIFDGLPMDRLDDIDKSVLVSNWIQRHMQFVEGRESNVQGKKYICEGYDLYSGAAGNLKTLIERKHGVCRAFASLTSALLNNPIVNCRTHIVSTVNGQHVYIVQIIDGKQYVVDNTWCTTRNPNKVEGALKATEFSDQYLLIGQDKINENEVTKADHTSRGVHKYEIEEKGIPRERIAQSVEKLKGMGVSFSYTEPPALESYIEDEQRET